MKKKLELLESEIDSIKILINELPTQTQEVKVGDKWCDTIRKEFGVQGNYLRIFGRTGYLIKDGVLADSETDIGLDGSLQMGLPFIEQGEVKGEYYAVVPDTVFQGVRISGRRGSPLKLKPPRNQISVGPFAGVIYDSKTGLTEPVFGFGVSYNMLKVWDWR